MTVAVIVPAHNEAAGITATLDSLLAQTQPPQRIIVVANNCTDDTADLARAYTGPGSTVDVLELPICPGRKAGAMNAGLRRLGGQRYRYVFTMDADTILDPDVLEQMAAELDNTPRRGALCARYWADRGHGLAWRLQRLEYARFDDTRELRRWKVQVASGAAVMYRTNAILDVLGRIRPDGPWDETSLIEDYALTLDLKTLGWTVAASATAHAHTATPQTFRDLWNQRTRWSRGGFEEVRKRGITPATARDAAAYGLFAVGVALRILFLTFLALLLIHGGGYAFGVLGAVIAAILLTDRITSLMPLRRWDRTDRLLAASLIIEDAYGLFLEACTLRAIGKSLVASDRRW